MAVLRGHIESLTSISFGAFDATPLAVTGSWDRTVRTWDLTTGQPSNVLQRHTGAVMLVQPSSSDTEACLCLQYPLLLFFASAGYTYTHVLIRRYTPVVKRCSVLQPFRLDNVNLRWIRAIHVHGLQGLHWPILMPSA